MSKEKLRYAILKEIDGGNTELSETDFFVSESEFDEAVRFLTNEKYLIGVMYYDDRPQLHKIGPALTEKGELYLKNNSRIGKAYRGLKEIRDWLKL